MLRMQLRHFKHTRLQIILWRLRESRLYLCSKARCKKNAQIRQNQLPHTCGEVRRIFTVGLPDRVVRGGQILFGPADGLLYVMTGIGTHRGDPYNFAQNKRSLLGKILRIDVDKGNEVHNQGLWGNYSIPRDNPYNNDKPISA